MASIIFKIFDLFKVALLSLIVFIIVSSSAFSQPSSQNENNAPHNSDTAAEEPRLLSFLREGPSILSEDAPDSINAVIEQRDDLAIDPRRRSLFPDF